MELRWRRRDVALFLAVAVVSAAVPAAATSKTTAVGRYLAYNEDMAICDQAEHACVKSTCKEFNDEARTIYFCR